MAKKLTARKKKHKHTKPLKVNLPFNPNGGDLGNYKAEPAKRAQADAYTFTLEGKILVRNMTDETLYRNANELNNCRWQLSNEIRDIESLMINIELERMYRNGEK